MRIHSSSFPGALSATMVALSCAVLAACGGGGSSSTTSDTSPDGTVNTNITAKYSSVNTTVGTTSSSSLQAFSGTNASSTFTTASTSGVGCEASGTGTTGTISYTYSWSCSGGSRTLTANGIPNHEIGVFPNDQNPNAISTEQGTISVSATLAPTQASAANYNVKVIGYGINGIKIDPNTGGGCNNSATSTATTGTNAQCTYDSRGVPVTWGLEALPSVTPFDFGADQNYAHVQPGGIYHYHGAPLYLFKALGGTVNSTTGVADKMVLIGWAADGFPIYYKYGHTDAKDSTTALKALKGNYLPNSSSTSLSTRPTSSVFPLGTFKNDWAYSASNGGDLDECNGRTGVTPQFPYGIYYYVVTDTYPFAPRCLKGNV